MAAVTKAAEPKAQPEKATRPERPNEEAYKADLAAAEKELAAVMQKLVCFLNNLPNEYRHCSAILSLSELRLM